MAAIGIDIGTSSISVIKINNENGNIIKSLTKRNDSALKDYCQDPNRIFELAWGMLEEISLSDVNSIGITGQMHGILYLDKEGKVISPLYTWQNELGNRLYDNSTYASFMSEKTGCKMASGYGFTSLFYHKERNELPKAFHTFASIGDYLAMRLSGQKDMPVHISNAHSFGLYDFKTKDFNTKMLNILGLGDIKRPRVSSDFEIVGKYKGISVSIAIGDNQASYLGSVKDLLDSILINIGTGSQVSYASSFLEGPLEVRPFVGDLYLHVKSGLCGGEAFNLLARFFSDISGQDIQETYLRIDKVIDEILLEDNIFTDLIVYPSFLGTRENPDMKGSISSITRENFTMKDLIIAFTKGILEELRVDHFARHLVASGNGIGKNKLMQKLLGNNLLMVEDYEEAAFGACLFSLIGSGYFKTLEEGLNLVKHKEV